MHLRTEGWQPLSPPVSSLMASAFSAHRTDEFICSAPVDMPAGELTHAQDPFSKTLWHVVLPTAVHIPAFFAIHRKTGFMRPIRHVLAIPPTEFSWEWMSQYESNVG